MAVAVLVSHSYFFVAGTSAAEPLHGLTGHSLGEHAVQVFFFLSGILVMQSFARSGSFIDFWAGRSLRIAPGLTVCVLLSAFVLGPLLTTLPASAYLGDPALPNYLAKTLLLMTGAAPLPGVFAHLPGANLVNMSLWTLKYEVLCYFGLSLVCVTGALTGPNKSWATAGIAIFVFGVFTGEPRPIEAYTATDNIRYFALYFGTGVLAYQLREHLVITGAPLVILALAYAHLSGTRWSELSGALLLGYATLYAGSFNFGRIGKAAQSTDLSFGVYIYAAPIQQTLVQLVPAIGGLALSATALALTAGLASASWTFVEKPAMARRKSVVGALCGAVAGFAPATSRPAASRFNPSQARAPVRKQG